MTYPVSLTESAAKSFKKLEQDIQIKLRPKVDQLADNPRPEGMEKLSDAENGYLIRVVNRRILYEIGNKILLVVVVKPYHRRTVYKN